MKGFLGQNQLFAQLPFNFALTQVKTLQTITIGLYSEIWRAEVNLPPQPTSLSQFYNNQTITSCSEYLPESVKVREYTFTETSATSNG